MDGPRLDHVSMAGDLAAFEELGFRPTLTSAGGRHARIFLDRVYLEVTPGAEDQAEPTARGWFLRPTDPFDAAEALRASGLRIDGPSSYRGEDGHWLDVQIDGPSSAVLPILTRRSDKTEELWPPALVDPHPNGARRISALRLRVGDPSALNRVLESLGVPPADGDRFRLPGGVSIQFEPAGDRPEGLVEVTFERTGGDPLSLTLKPAAR